MLPRLVGFGIARGGGSGARRLGAGLTSSNLFQSHPQPVSALLIGGAPRGWIDPTQQTRYYSDGPPPLGGPLFKMTAGQNDDNNSNPDGGGMMRRSYSSLTAAVRKLPHLPVPDVTATLERLLKSCAPIAQSPQELEQLSDLLSRFERDGTAEKLHRLLMVKATQTPNWLSVDWWVNKAYLDGRDPIMLWSSPCLTIPRSQASMAAPPSREAVAHHTSRLIVAVLKFRDFIRSGGNPEADPRQPDAPPKLCMDQYNRIFGTCRIPGEPSDSLHVGSLVEENIRLIVSRNDRFYELDLTDHCENGYTQDGLAEEIAPAIRSILDAYPSDEDLPIGALTAGPRDQWARAYTQLDPDSVAAIRDSAFVVCLDRVTNARPFSSGSSAAAAAAGGESSPEYYNSLTRQLLLSDSRNIGNRWFDKTIQLIVATNDSGDQLLGSGFCYEHTPAEGGAIVKMAEYAVEQLQSGSGGAPPPGRSPITARPLGLVSNEHRIKMTDYTREAMSSYGDLAGGLDLNVVRFSAYGRDTIKSFKMSPDSWCQVAINWAYYRTHGHQVGTCYESAATRKFAFGRTETIRSVTSDMAAFFRDSTATRLRAAIESHKQVVGNSLNGQGVDRMLLAFRAIAEEVQNGTWTWGGPAKDLNISQADRAILDELYANPLFQRARSFDVSTSQVASRSPDIFMAYGPLKSSGYGCCYNPTPRQLIFTVSSFPAVGEEFRGRGTTDVRRFSSALYECLVDMQKLTVTSQSKL